MRPREAADQPPSERPDSGAARSERPAAIVAILAMTAGATDAICFLGLGGVFASVMTANMVLLGLSAGQRDGGLAEHSAAALAGYILGALTASRLTRSAGPPPSRWPPVVRAALLAEAAVLVAVAVGWEITGSHRAGTAQLALLAGAACAMGIQGATVRAMGARGISTTYMTGLLTELIAEVARTWKRPAGTRLLPLGMLVLGAVLTGVTVALVPRLAPLIVLAPLTVVIAAAFRAG